ncbi:MAG: peptidoglycan-binding domain-containing protein [Candidatus Paceibacterota bacterium]|jgi:peptidoglycan hydrolase-like protein with peptidoglycan-binding domain
MSKLLKSKILLALMVVAVVAIVGVSSTLAYTHTITLRQGSSGAQVASLQSALGVTADGQFGPITKAAVVSFQSAHGLVADGVVGAMTGAALSGTVSGSYPAGCTSTAGYSSTTGLPCNSTSSLPAGCTSTVGYSPTTGVACSTVVTGLPAGCTSTAGYSPTTGESCSGTTTVVNASGEGSITVTYDAVPADNLAIYRGENKAAMALKIKATGSDMKVTRLWLDINTRIWLSADSVSLLDGSTVIATLPLSASTVEEVTVGSAWRLQFNSLNFVVPVGTTKVLTVNVSRPTATAADSSVTIATTSTVRAVDAAGISDTYTLTGRTWNMASAAAAVGTLTNTLNANSPVAQSVSGLSTTAGTLTDVKLMDFDLKATTGAVNVTAIAGTITTSGSCTAAQCISSLELRDGATVLDSVTGAGTFSFTEQDIDVPKDGTKTLSIWAKVNHIAASYVVAGDSIYAIVNSVTGTSGPSYTAANNTIAVTGYAQHLFRYAPTIAFVSATATPEDQSTSTTLNTGGNYTLAFSVTAPSGSDIFVNTPAFIVGQANVPTKTTFGVGGTIVVSTAVSGATLKGAGNTATWDKIPAGQSRTFTLSAHIPHGGNAGYVGIKINTAATAGIAWSSDVDEDGSTDILQVWGVDDLKTGLVYVTAN